MRTIPQRREEPALLFHEEGIIHARGDMPIALQAKLLRFLDQWTVRAVGSASEETVDVQVVSATNSGLKQALEKRQFRADLLYRLRGVEVTLPPLRERSDFPEVVHALLAEHTADCSISDDAIRTMREHSWPGNFRELKNFLLRMILVAKLFGFASERCLPRLQPDERAFEPRTSSHGSERPEKKSKRYDHCNLSLLQWECHPDRPRTRVSRHTIYRELRRMGIDRPKSRRSGGNTPDAR
jgi:transcriptional regulator of acetoin/glycerol metabolism